MCIVCFPSRRAIMNVTLWWLVICFIIKTSLSCHNDSTCTKISLTSLPEDIFMRAIRCHVWCLKQYEVVLQFIDVYHQWPSLNVSSLISDCYKYQKVEQCQLGCVIAIKSPTLTVNKCRDSCYSTCIQSCNGKKECTLSANTCSRKCRKTFCKKGCLYSPPTLHQSSFIPAKPSSPPTLTLSDSQDYSYSVSFPSNNTVANSNTSDWVNFLFKVQDQQEGTIRYYWQTDLTLTLKLSAFACRHVQVSMSVLTAEYKTDYSPATSVCLHKDIEYPSQVKAELIKVNYQEDPHLISFVMMNITWVKPQDHRAVSSYSVYFLSSVSECGGVGQLFPYEGLKENKVVVSANKLAQFPRFGCTYEMMLKVHPSLDNRGAQIRVTPQLPELTEEMKLSCSCVRISNGPLLLIVNWTLPNDSMIIETVDQFELIIKNHYKTNIKSNASQTWYNFSTWITNLTAAGLITVTLDPVKTTKYYWRHIPRSQSCQVSVPANIPLNIRIVEQHIDSSVVQLNVSWSTSSPWPTHVELVIGSTLANPVHTVTVEVQLHSAVVQVTNSSNDYLWARSLQNSTASSWSNPVQIQVQKNHQKGMDDIEERLDELEEKVETLTKGYELMKLLTKQVERFKQELNNVTDHLISK